MGKQEEASKEKCPDLGRLIPEPARVYRRLGEVLREARLLRRQLRLSLRFREELQRREETRKADGGNRRE